MPSSARPATGRLEANRSDGRRLNMRGRASPRLARAQPMPARLVNAHCHQARRAMERGAPYTAEEAATIRFMVANNECRRHERTVLKMLLHQVPRGGLSAEGLSEEFRKLRDTRVRDLVQFTTAMEKLKQQRAAASRTRDTAKSGPFAGLWSRGGCTVAVIRVPHAGPRESARGRGVSPADADRRSATPQKQSGSSQRQACLKDRRRGSLLATQQSG
mmetsp:Transcript_7/g.21  ORF Transcript_7/g.21 Transcript_7/m.21 type:complete len:217 (+) Transcript_7:102-752(+)